MKSNDKYYDYNNGVLKNKLRIKDNEKLNQAESDMVIVRIHEVFNNMYFTPSVEYLLNLHKKLFSDVYEFAGNIRDIQIYKEERLLTGLSVDYSLPENIINELNNIFNNIRNTNFNSLNKEKQIDYITKTICDIWKVHPFREGNTRTTLVLLRCMLHSYGIEFRTSFFATGDNFKYMRDALVAASFEAEDLGVKRNYYYVKKMISDIIEQDIEKKRGI